MIQFRLTATVRDESALPVLASLVVNERGITSTSSDPARRELHVDAQGLAGEESLTDLARRLRARPDVIEVHVRRADS
jgi:hypothetical protein